MNVKQNSEEARRSRDKEVEEVRRQMTNSDWHPFFDRYVFGTEIPDV
ncbi:MAG: hypothetical protein LJE95_15135 [Acidobacteria bacterium]|jgi:predicted metalloprotease with PDZ domain|nr:hypothetical protein [Acidobacteriota bacterium]